MRTRGSERGLVDGHDARRHAICFYMYVPTSTEWMMEQSFESHQVNQNLNDAKMAGATGPVDSNRSSIATSVERAVETGALKVHGAIDASKDALHSGVRRADGAIADVKHNVDDAVNRVAQNPQVEEFTRGLEQQVRTHPVRTMAIALGSAFSLGAR
ncbi:MAG: hypothetical protein ABJD07_11495 [Gemmatimonadaceae bacterium]